MHPSGDPSTSLFLKADLVVFCDVLKQLAVRRILDVFLSISCLAEGAVGTNCFGYFSIVKRHHDQGNLFLKALNWGSVRTCIMAGRQVGIGEVAEAVCLIQKLEAERR